jgi:hypothetical protein
MIPSFSNNNRGNDNHEIQEFSDFYIYPTIFALRVLMYQR